MIVAQLGDMQGQAQPAEVVGQLDGISAVDRVCLKEVLSLDDITIYTHKYCPTKVDKCARVCWCASESFLQLQGTYSTGIPTACSLYPTAPMVDIVNSKRNRIGMFNGFRQHQS